MPKKNTTKSITYFLALSFLTLSSLSNFATSGDKNTVEVQLRTVHPHDYTVVKGDALWDIAEKFLHNPWVWPEIWDANPQIKNPHLIYPGDVISVLQKDGETVLHVERPPENLRIRERPPENLKIRERLHQQAIVTKTNRIENGLNVIKLSPKVRIGEKDEAIKTIDASAILSFIINPQILTAEEYEKLPYIIGNFEGHLISSIGQEAYVRGLENTNEYRYSIYHKGETFMDPENNFVLGYEAILSGYATILEFDDPSTVLIKSSRREIFNGDRLIPSEQNELDYNIVPNVSKTIFEGRIVALFDALTQSARNQIIVLNLGKRDGLDIGNILSINSDGGTIIDKRDLDKDNVPATVRIPDVRSGIVMIFKVFDRLSYGLIMSSKRPIHVNDRVATPQ
jgi:LysM repeat protein